MKTKELRKLALYGLTAGLLTVSQSGLSAGEDATDLDIEHMIARPKCNDSGHCGGLTALRNTKNATTNSAAPSDEDLDTEEGDTGGEEEIQGFGA